MTEASSGLHGGEAAAPGPVLDIAVGPSAAVSWGDEYDFEKKSYHSVHRRRPH
jgi:hypothetical protein